MRNASGSPRPEDGGASVSDAGCSPRPADPHADPLRGYSGTGVEPRQVFPEAGLGNVIFTSSEASQSEPGGAGNRKAAIATVDR
jgi:hypothetical protein